MRLRLVHAPGGNLFMRDLLVGVAAEAQALGVDAEVVDGAFPADPDTVYVVVPHEYFVVTEPSGWPSQDQLARTVALTVEHPGTPWFEVSAVQARRCAAVLDINLDSTAELNRRGVTARHFQLGYTSAWDSWNGSQGPRPHDIVYLGSADERRDAALADYARHWTERRVRLLLPSEAPRTGAQADYLPGPEKRRLLARSTVLVNLHRGVSRALEWVRVLEAMSNGCVVVSEHSLDADPLIPGEHFVSAGLASVGLLTDDLLDDPARVSALRQGAYDFLRSELPMAPAVQRLVELAGDLLRRPRRLVAVPVDEPERGVARALPWRAQTPDSATRLGGQVRELRRRVTVLEIEAARAAGRAGPRGDGVVPVYRTPSHRRARPTVSVLVPLYNKAEHVAEALESVVVGTESDVELLVLDDGSEDDSLLTVQRWLDEHDHVPAQLLRHVTNTGPAQVRNRLLETARADLVFTLDADNGVYPTCLAALVGAIEGDPTACFAYGPIEMRADGTPVGLTSSRPLLAGEMRYGNYVDNMALFRTGALRRLGGWDENLDTWEDFDLWLRVLEAGEHGVFVPQVHSWYRLQSTTLRMAAGLDMPGLWARLRRSSPTVLAEHDPGVPDRPAPATSGVSPARLRAR